MWFMTNDGRWLNLRLMTSVSFTLPGRITYTTVGRTDSFTVSVPDTERERVAMLIVRATKEGHDG